MVGEGSSGLEELGSFLYEFLCKRWFFVQTNYCLNPTLSLNWLDASYLKMTPSFLPQMTTNFDWECNMFLWDEMKTMSWIALECPCGNWKQVGTFLTKYMLKNQWSLSIFKPKLFKSTKTTEAKSNHELHPEFQLAFFIKHSCKTRKKSRKVKVKGSI